MASACRRAFLVEKIFEIGESNCYTEMTELIFCLFGKRLLLIKLFNHSTIDFQYRTE